MAVMSKFDLDRIKAGVKNCLIEKNCKKCPYYKLYYNNPGESCLDELYKDINLVLLRFDILTDNKD